MKTTLVAVVASLVIAAAATATATTRTFTGGGTQLLPPFTLTHGATVRWRERGGLFMLIALRAPAAAGPNAQLIVSQAPSGRAYLPPGRYAFKVSAFGAWSVTFG